MSGSSSEDYLLLISLIIGVDSFVHLVAEDEFSTMHHDQFGLLDSMIVPPEGDFGKMSVMAT